MNMNHLVAVIAALGAVAVACSKPSDNTQATKPAETHATTTTASAGGAKEIFAARCTACHGTSGKGDGAAAAALTPKPRDYTSKDWQASVTDAQLKKVIVGGGAAVGKSAAMPPNPDLEGKPELDGLVAIVREFGK